MLIVEIMSLLHPSLASPSEMLMATANGSTGPFLRLIPARESCEQRTSTKPDALKSTS